MSAMLHYNDFGLLPLYNSESWLSVTVYVCGLPLSDSESWLCVTVCFVICLCMIQRAGYMSPYVL